MLWGTNQTVCSRGTLHRLPVRKAGAEQGQGQGRGSGGGGGGSSGSGGNVVVVVVVVMVVVVSGGGGSGSGGSGADAVAIVAQPACRLPKHCSVNFLQMQLQSARLAECKEQAAASLPWDEIGWLSKKGWLSKTGYSISTTTTTATTTITTHHHHSPPLPTTNTTTTTAASALSLPMLCPCFSHRQRQPVQCSPTAQVAGLLVSGMYPKLSKPVRLSR